MNKYIMEFVGTFFLVLTIGCTVIPGAPGVIPPLAIGSVLAVMIFAGGHISGGHYNPAVTLAVWVRGRCDTKDVVPYWVAQVVGAVVAAMVTKFLVGPAKGPAMALALGPAFIAEFLFTFALGFVVVNVATSKDTANNSFYGLAIGFTVLAGAFAVGGVSGGAFNPAVAVAISTLGLVSWSNIWVYLVANLMGGTLAGLMFKVLNPTDK